MRYYPVFLDLRGVRCVVVGGGEVAQRKVDSLLRCGAAVTVISPAVTGRLAALAAAGRIRHLAASFGPGMLEGARLVISAADSPETNALVAAEARAAGVPVNCADDPRRCDFIVPSVVERGALTVAVSTSGRAPFLARRLRRELEARFTPAWAVYVDILGAVRDKLLKEGVKYDKKKSIFNKLLDSPIAGWVEEGRADLVESFLSEILGREVTLEGLGIDASGAGRPRRQGT